MFLLVLIPFALVLVVLSVLGLAGIGLLGDERRAERSGAAGALGPVVGLLIGGGMLVLAVAGAFALVGLGGGDESDERHRETGTAAASDSTSRATTPEHPETRAPTLGAAVRIEADAGATFPVSYDVADRLAPDTVLPIHVVGFGPFAAAVAEQCAPSLSRRCENQIAVQFDADGEAHFQYLVSDEFLEAQAIPGRCRADAAPCTIVVRTADGERRGSIQTIFVDAIPVAGRIEVTPSTGLSLDGERVTVTVHDYPPGGEVAAMLCAAPDATGSRCGAPGPTARIAVGADGTAAPSSWSRPDPWVRRGCRALGATTAASRLRPPMCSRGHRWFRSRSPRLPVPTTTELDSRWASPWPGSSWGSRRRCSCEPTGHRSVRLRRPRSTTRSTPISMRSSRRSRRRKTSSSGVPDRFLAAASPASAGRSSVG